MDQGRNREGLRDNPDDLWAHVGDDEYYSGNTSEAERPETYRMQIVSGFAGSEVATIDSHQWELWFRDKDNGVNKDEAYYNKVMQAIAAWNNVSTSERITFLRTGKYTTAINEDLISTLTSGRIIGFQHKESGPHGPLGGGRHGEDDDTDDSRSHGPHDPFGGKRWHGKNDGTGSSERHGPLGELRRHESDKKLGRRGSAVFHLPLGLGRSTQAIPPTRAIVRDEAIVHGTATITSKPISREPKTYVDEAHVEPEPRIHGEVFVTSEPKVDSDPDTAPEPVSRNPETKSDDPATDPEPISHDPEAEKPQENETFEIIKIIRRRELPPEEQEAVAEEVDKKKKLLAALRRTGYLALVVPLLAVSPIDPEAHGPAAHVTATTTETTTTQYPSIEREQEIPADEHEQILYDMVAQELRKISLGDEVEVPYGTVLHNSSDPGMVEKNGGQDPIVIISENSLRPEGKYKVDRVAFLDEEGTIIATFDLEDGDSGDIIQLIQQLRSETGYEDAVKISLHYSMPTDKGDLPTGWTDDYVEKLLIKKEEQIPETITVMIPGQTIETTIEKEYSGESDDLFKHNGRITIENEDGQIVQLFVLDREGGVLPAGSKVTGSDGRTYEIKNVTVEDRHVKFTINPLAVAHIATIAGLMAALAYAGSKEREAEPKEGIGEAGADGTKPETEIEREMMELNSEQLIRLAEIFSQKAGDNAHDIAVEFATKAGIETAEEEPRETTATEGGPESATEEVNTDDTKRAEESPVFKNMTEDETLLAKALLAKHDEVTLHDLSERVGIDLDEYADQIMNGTQSEEEN